MHTPLRNFNSFLFKKKKKKILVICFSHLKWIYKVFVFRYASISIFFEEIQVPIEVSCML